MYCGVAADKVFIVIVNSEGMTLWFVVVEAKPVKLLLGQTLSSRWWCVHTAVLS